MNHKISAEVRDWIQTLSYEWIKQKKRKKQSRRNEKKRVKKSEYKQVSQRLQIFVVVFFSSNKTRRCVVFPMMIYSHTSPFIVYNNQVDSMRCASVTRATAMSSANIIHYNFKWSVCCLAYVSYTVLTCEHRHIHTYRLTSLFCMTSSSFLRIAIYFRESIKYLFFLDR